MILYKLISDSIISILSESCQPHRPYLQILERCTSFFSLDDAAQLNFMPSVYVELNLWYACFLSSGSSTSTSIRITHLKSPFFRKLESFLVTSCNGPYLEHFLCKSVSRWLLHHRPLFDYISSDIYYLAFPNDPLQRKLLVYAVYTAELVQAILLARMAYTEFAVGFGNIEAINTISLLSVAVPILSSIGMRYPFFLAVCNSLQVAYKLLVTAVVQIFYAHRIKILADSYLIPSVVVLVNLSSSISNG